MYGKLSNREGQGQVESYNQLFRRIDQIQAWQTILGLPMLTTSDFITSPFRLNDTRPGCYLRNRGGLVLFTDFAYPQYNKYTCCHALAELNGLTLRDAAIALISNQIYGLPLKVHTLFRVEQGGKRLVGFGDGRADIHFETFIFHGQPTYTEVDKDYWSPRGVSITDLLNPSQPAYSVHHYFINGEKYYPVTYPCYGLYFPLTGRVKLYMPNGGRQTKFISNTSTSDVWRWDSTDPFLDLCIITKSYKDGLLLSKATDIDIWAFQNEGVQPQEAIDQINARYYRKIILYDNDEPGMHAASKLQERLPGSVTMFYPRHLGKDTDDVVLNAGYDFIKQYINHGIYQ